MGHGGTKVKLWFNECNNSEAALGGKSKNVHSISSYSVSFCCTCKKCEIII